MHPASNINHPASVPAGREVTSDSDDRGLRAGSTHTQTYMHMQFVSQLAKGIETKNRNFTTQHALFVMHTHYIYTPEPEASQTVKY